MANKKIPLNGFGRLGRIQESLLAASIDSLRVRDKVDVPELDFGKLEDKETTERFHREIKTEQYADLRGRRFRPTFDSNIDYFEIRGYDAERDMVLTVAHPKGVPPSTTRLRNTTSLELLRRASTNLSRTTPCP